MVLVLSCQLQVLGRMSSYLMVHMASVRFTKVVPRDTLTPDAPQLP